MAELCPECQSELSPLRLDPGSVTTCARCAGVCVNAAVLKRHAPDELMVRLWSAARASTTASHRTCPGCGQRLRVFVSDALQLDACARCQLLWLDGGEIERLGVTLRTAKVSDDATRERAHAKAKLQRELKRDREQVVEEANLLSSLAVTLIRMLRDFMLH